MGLECFIVFENNSSSRRVSIMERIINMIGVLSVVGSLFFVAIELRQSQQIALADQVQARTNQGLARNLIFLEGQWELGHKINTTPYIDLTEPEKWASEQLYAWQKEMEQNSFYQYRAGLLDEEHWMVVSERIKVQWNNCSIRHTYDFTQLELSYADYLKSLDDPCV